MISGSKLWLWNPVTGIFKEKAGRKLRIRHIKGAEEAVHADPFVINDPETYKGCWSGKVFGNDAPIYLEVGMGMGTFIRTHSFLHPEINYIGFEINTTVLYKSVKRYREALIKMGRPAEPSSSNLRFIRSDARFLEEYFAPGETGKIYLNFSDPWPKDKNANKRLTSPHFLALYRSILEDGGCIEFKTDNENLFNYSLGTFSSEGWSISAYTRDLHNDAVLNEGNIMTEYEAKFSAKGNPVFKLITCKSSEPSEFTKIIPVNACIHR